MSSIPNNLYVDEGSRSKSSGSMSSIINDRDTTSSILNTQSDSLLNSGKQLNDQYNLMKSTKNVFDEILESADEEIKTWIKRNKYIEEFNKSMKDSIDLMAKLTLKQQQGNIEADELNQLTKDVTNTLLDQEKNLSIINNIFDLQNKKINTNTDDLEMQNALVIQGFKDQQKAAEDAYKAYKKAIEGSKKNLLDAFKSDVKDMRRLLTDFSQTMDLSKLASMSDRSTASKVQEQLQVAYGMNRSEFKTFKTDINKSVNTSVYSNEQMQNVYSELLQLGLGNADTAKKQFNTILRGQELLGLQADTQAKLLQLGNKTGRDQLKFTTNRVAQYMKSATNLSKSQLNQLINMNTTLKSQLADIGVSSDVFDQKLDDITVGLTNYMKGDDTLANLYRGVLSSGSLNTDYTSLNFGMFRSEFNEQTKSGTSIFDMLKNGGPGLAQDTYRGLSSGALSMQDLQDRIEFQGLDSNLASLIKQTVDIERSTGRSIDQVLSEYKSASLSDEELIELEKERARQEGGVTKWVNSISNWVFSKLDMSWYDNVHNYLKVIIKLLTTMEAMDILKDVGSYFSKAKKAGVSWFTGQGKGGALFGSGSLLGGTKGISKYSYGNGLLGNAMKGIGTAGVVMAGANFIGGMGTTSDEMFGSNANIGQRALGGLTGMFSGTTVHKDKNGKVDVGKNIGMGALSGAATGAMVGSLFGPVGTAIGAGVGLVGGLAFGWLKGEQAKKQQAISEAQLKKEQEIAQNTATTADQVRSIGAVVAANRNIPAYVAPQGSKGDMIPSFPTSSAGMGDMYNGYDISPYSFSSPYISEQMAANGGGRVVTKNGKVISSGPHHGIDFAAPEGTPIGAAASGTVVFSGHESEPGGWGGGGYQTRIKGDDGLTYAYAHQCRRPPVKVGQKVEQGQLIGYVGQTGAASGPHLHFGLYNGGTEMDPTPYVNSSIFTVSSNGVSLGKSSSISNSNGINQNQSTSTNGYVYKLRSMGDMSNNSNEPIVAGLAQINQTLIDLSNRQSRDEQILNILTSKQRQNPVY